MFKVTAEQVAFIFVKKFKMIYTGAYSNAPYILRRRNLILTLILKINKNSINLNYTYVYYRVVTKCDLIRCMNVHSYEVRGKGT